MNENISPELLREVLEFQGLRTEEVDDFLQLVVRFQGLTAHQTLTKASRLRPKHVGQQIVLPDDSTGMLNDVEVSTDLDRYGDRLIVVSGKIVRLKDRDVVLLNSNVGM